MTPLGLLFAVLAVAAAGLALAGLIRLSHRSGVSDADLTRPLPGDDLVPAPRMLADRAGLLDAPPERIWPWLVQLGKDRAGWYFPAWAERLLPAGWHGARALDPRYLGVQVGKRIPDYGPGQGEFKAMQMDAPRVLVYYSVRRPSANWTWPAQDAPLPPDALALSWALILEPVAENGTRLYIRLRADPPGRKALAWPVGLAGGLFDWLTIALLFQGLNERLKDAAPLPDNTNATHIHRESHE